MQRVPVWKIVVIALVLLFSLWMLMPTLTYYSYPSYYRNAGITPELEELQKQSQEAGGSSAELAQRIRDEKERFNQLQSNSIRLGLDLQGGVHLVIEVDRVKFRQELKNQNLSESEIEDRMESVLDIAAEVVSNRVDQFGVAEVAIVKQPPDRIVVEMPGFNRPEQVAELVKADADLTFNLVAPDTLMGQVITDIDSVISEDFGSYLASTLPMGRLGVVTVPAPENVAIVDEILQRSEVQSLIPRGFILRWGNEEYPDKRYNFSYRFLYLLEERADVTGKNLETAGVYFDPSTGQPQVSLSFDDTGTVLFRRLTESNIGKNLAIVLDDTVYSAPTLETPIRDGNARITGINNFDEARQTAVVLRAGALPAPMNIAESRVVGPSLGADSIRSGIYAGIVGGLAVIIFMIVYYSVCGAVANIAVILNLVLLLAGMAMFKATLTLPGIAGVLLTIGMAVDANVLIYERMREELHGKRTKTMALVLEKSYNRAFMTIFDANITTLITALVLFQFGTGPIKGFAVTLSLGIIISMFTAVFVSRVIMDMMLAYGVKTIPTGNFFFFRNANYDFFQYGRSLMYATVAIGLVGFLYLAITWDSHKGIDFAGGTEIIAEFQEDIAIQDVRQGIQSIGITESVIQRVLGEENQVIIRVPSGETASDAPNVWQERMAQAFPNSSFELLQVDSVSAKVGGELLLKGIYCLIFASIGILLYITARFEFRFAVAAVATLFHDLLFTLAVLAFVGTEFNLPIIAALLTVLGYSLNDTIVVFDRIRENYHSALLNFKEVVNLSINQTLSRTVNTGLTTLFILLMMHLFGGAAIHDFAFTLIIGVIIGTYSSIFIASPLLLIMGKQPPAPKKTEKELRPAAA